MKSAGSLYHCPEYFDGWGIVSELIECSPAQVVTKSSIVNPEGKVVCVGHAQETWDGSKILRTSAVEVCETSSIGRALASIGLAGEEYASANEVQGAIAQQEAGHSNKPKKPRQTANSAPKRAAKAKPAETPEDWVQRAKEAFAAATNADQVMETIAKIGKGEHVFASPADFREALGHYAERMSQGFTDAEIGRAGAAVACLLGDVPDDRRILEKEAQDVF